MISAKAASWKDRLRATSGGKHTSASVGIMTGVETNNGIVTLSGKATSGAGKDMATKVASDVHGVVSVVNKMIL